MTANHNHHPPGPRGLPFVGVSFQIVKDPLGLMLSMARDYGDIVRFPVVGQHRILLNHPDWIEQVLVIHHNKFHKSDFTKRAVERILGQGLLISEGDFWRRQRRLAQPAFHKARINEYASTMVQIAQAHEQGWRDGDTRDMAHEMMALTLDVAVRTLFGTTLPGEAEKIGEALTFLMRYSLRRLRAPIRIPPHWPTPRNRRAQRDHDFLDSVVYRIIDERKARGDSAEHDDLLSLLMGAMDDDGSQMTPKQLRDETMTLFLAGHETTALTLAWGWYLLSQNPRVESQLHEELRGVLTGRAPELADLNRLPYLQAVVNEILRLYPPAYISARTSIEPCQIGGYDFPAGTTFLMSQWVTHRDPRYFDEPEAFRPERWLDGLMDRLPPGAYFPFGGGPRRCIGQGFALLEASLVLAEVAQHFRFALVPGQEIVPEPLVTLRAKNGIRMTLRARN
ncbi:MAG TPA: cytochrome P450 [Candidatus Acidoferrales bacterium]|nr:cytochrome P450 [Candidatus Acidoferrales bacterium]